MQHLVFSILLLFICMEVISCSPVAAPRSVESLHVPGQKVFHQMGCFTCHAVPDPAVRPPITSLQSTMPLTATTFQKDTETLQQAILDPDHLKTVAGRNGSIGNYREVLTVQELMDVTRYIQSLPAVNFTAEPAQPQ